jgi:hypothetical protein
MEAKFAELSQLQQYQVLKDSLPLFHKVMLAFLVAMLCLL